MMKDSYCTFSYAFSFVNLDHLLLEQCQNPLVSFFYTLEGFFKLVVLFVLFHLDQCFLSNRLVIVARSERRTNKIEDF